ncbi:unnamed protein product [Arabidopsis lyrata]|nr:unnamed protein product [Arabidopsis lyrata]
MEIKSRNQMLFEEIIDLLQYRNGTSAIIGFCFLFGRRREISERVFISKRGYPPLERTELKP